MKVIKVTGDYIKFENDVILCSDHYQDCCESHYLDFSDLSLSDFEGLEFDLSGDGFFNKVEGYGIELVPIKGFPVRVPDYGSNNGYYSSNLILTLSGKDFNKEHDISECQNIDWC